ncbi:MAG: radical SAM protein [Candidatus Micrarchaeia archaeon]
MRKWKLGWGYTSSCNMHCGHCYSKKVRCETSIQKDNKLKFAKMFIRSNKQYIESINYGTGENVLDKTWWKLFEFCATETGILQGLTTNGSLAKFVQHVELIKKLNDVDVSIDFGESKLHDNFRGFKGAWKLAVDTLDLCNSNSISRTIVTVAMNINFNENNMELILKLASEYNSNIRINILRPTYPGLKKYVVEPLQFYKVMKWLLQNTYVVSISDVLFSSILRENKYKGDFVGKSSMRILENGEITPSTYLIDATWRTSNIFTDNISLRAFKFEILEKNPVPVRCTKCSLASQCMGGTIDRRILWGRTLLERDPYCPSLNNIALNYFDDINIVYDVSKNNTFVHEDYLPTIILKPR